MNLYFALDEVSGLLQKTIFTGIVVGLVIGLVKYMILDSFERGNNV